MVTDVWINAALHDEFIICCTHFPQHSLICRSGLTQIKALKLLKSYNPLLKVTEHLHCSIHLFQIHGNQQLALGLKKMDMMM